MVKEEIPRYDLRTHVCFCRSHQRVGALYGSDDEQEQFAHRACWLAGLGLLPGENPEEVSWRKIAFECVERDGFWSDQPELPVCGGDLLMVNAQNMRSAIDQAGYPVEELSAHPALDYIPEEIHTYRFHADSHRPSLMLIPPNAGILSASAHSIQDQDDQTIKKQSNCTKRRRRRDGVTGGDRSRLIATHTVLARPPRSRATTLVGVPRDVIVKPSPTLSI
ncbi:hypothetical protein SCP_0313350 [Sparassis crispa]|uniref:Uncharacterized protein n=1 Tax=Sparassis crispa TaxID=139825 RepID=A0A401GHD2_9APHY|nr:hypothetical protein SCP_0313350 [Sparassis crispa]GBE81606.1 hypothetical protein SCP_0313350 [Sparassis crispa]